VNRVFNLISDSIALEAAEHTPKSHDPLSGAQCFFIDCPLAAVGHKIDGPAKVSVIASALFGSIPGSAIANSSGYDLIVIGKRCQGILRSGLMGDTAHRVIRHAKVPVRVTPIPM
jgi:hypothetical protein